MAIDKTNHYVSFSDTRSAHEMSKREKPVAIVPIINAKLKLSDRRYNSLPKRLYRQLLNIMIDVGFELWRTNYL